MKIPRNGYGSFYNELYIEGDNVIKFCKHPDGMEKIRNEISFFSFIKNNSINFPIVDVVSHSDDRYTMKFLDGYPLYKNPTNIEQVYKHLEQLHTSKTIEVSKDDFIKNIKLETEQKILDRFQSFEDFNFIKKVNNFEILEFKKLLKKINELIFLHLPEKFEIVPIHGDCQFNNIIVNSNNEMVFIDPRGYFGEYKIYGPKEYDYAKVLFALSGYDDFDNRDIESIDIEGDNINVELNIIDETIFEKLNLSSLLMCTIWLGNAHCFIHSKEKMVTSYFIALYVGSRLLHRHHHLERD